MNKHFRFAAWFLLDWIRTFTSHPEPFPQWIDQFFADWQGKYANLIEVEKLLDCLADYDWNEITHIWDKRN